MEEKEHITYRGNRGEITVGFQSENTQVEDIGAISLKYRKRERERKERKEGRRNEGRKERGKKQLEFCTSKVSFKN